MYQMRNYETVNVILRDPSLWGENMMRETLQRFQKSNSHTDHDFNPSVVQELIKSYLQTLSAAMKKENMARKERNSEERLHDLSHVSVSGI